METAAVFAIAILMHDVSTYLLLLVSDSGEFVLLIVVPE
jgi:hypothetical protein